MEENVQIWKTKGIQKMFSFKGELFVDIKRFSFYIKP